MTLLIIIITSIFSFIAFNNSNIFNQLRFNPYIIKREKQWYRFISGGLIHADTVHLLINMFVLYSFGSELEMYMHYYFGEQYRFLLIIMYITAIALPLYPSYRKNKDNPYYNAVGASGAVASIVFACIIYNPLAKYMIIFIPIQIPAFIFGILYLIYSAYMAHKKIDNIGHDVHFFGALYGIFFTIILKPELILNLINLF
jgi:membrane associated rhomboid family serine protease